ncbi:Phosphatase DCR2 [Spathaspora sp. JA1]|nr:Phosphatase DCR2 [Spathaspora sp. JA1]
MVGLPRRLLRVLSYLIFFLVLACTLLLLANKHELIELEKYISFASGAPAFFQPPSDSFIVDIAITDCFLYNKNNKECGLPSPSDGAFGELGEMGGWRKVTKDIGLGKSWVKQQFFSYKELNHRSLGSFLKETGAKDEVVIDIAIANRALDSKIKGNEKLKLPRYILENFHETVEDEVGKITSEKIVEKTEKLEAERKANKDATSEEERKEKEAKLAKEAESKEQQEENSREKEKEILQLEEASKENEVETEKEQEKGPKNFEEDIKPQSPTVKDKVKREIVNDRSKLERNLYVPSKQELDQSGWRYKSNGIWLKYASHEAAKALTGIDLLFGPEAVDPRPNWNLIPNPISNTLNPKDLPVFLTFRRGPKLNYKEKYAVSLKMHADDSYKILQVADLHFSTGYGKCRDPSPPSSSKDCRADERTLQFLEKVLDIEKPDFVVLTGDQVFGDEAPDAESAVFKALNPFIKRKIPFAVTMGNHDDEGSLSRKEMMSVSVDLPYSQAAVGPVEVEGIGNYVVTITGKSASTTALSLYFLDTHKYSKNPKVTPGYDWIKENQLTFLQEEYASLKSSIDSYPKTHMAMAFFHIPIPEYRNLEQPFIGENREGVTAPRYNSGARKILGELGVKVTSVGHDHCNDYCLLDEQKQDGDNKMWLCYGGGVGEGGYGGYNGYVRRLRMYELNTAKGEIKSWKRAENDPNTKIDEQILVSDGNVVNW